MSSNKIVAVNSQGFFNGDINRFISNHKEKPDALICTEHKQRDLSAISDSIEGYTLAAGYPATTGQRGTAVFVKDGVEYYQRPDLDTYSREGVFEGASVEIINPDQNLVLTGVYRSPSSSKAEYNKTLDEVANHVKNEPNKKHVIGGDLNIDLTTNRTTTNEVLRNNDLRYHIRSSTHDAGRCLDNFITSNGSGCIGRRLNSTFSDHRPIQLQVPTTPSARPTPYGSSPRRSRSTASGLRSDYGNEWMIGNTFVRGFESLDDYDGGDSYYGNGRMIGNTFVRGIESFNDYDGGSSYHGPSICGIESYD